jgi:hypothetical protein
MLQMRLISVLAAALALSGAAAPPVSAQTPPCPIADDAVVAQALASDAVGGILADPFDMTKPMDTGLNTVCMWDIDGNENMLMVTLSPNSFGPDGAADPADLALRSARLPEEARQVVQGLRDAGVTDIQLPTLKITPASGVGDSSAWVYQEEPSLGLISGGYFIQRGADALIVSIAGQDELTAQSRTMAVAQAVLSTLP